MRITGIRTGLLFPEWFDVSVYDLLGARGNTLRHIPAALQGEWSRLQAATIDAFCDSPTATTLCGMLALPKLVLRPAKVRGKHAAAHMADLIRSRLRSFQNGNWLDLWRAFLSETSPPEGVQTRANKRAKTDASAPDSVTLRRARQSLAEGCSGKAVQQLKSTGIHDAKDPLVSETLRKLHPVGRPVESETLPARLPLDLGDEDTHSFWDPLIRDGIASFPRGTAPGPSGLRASHLQDAIRRPGRGAILASALARLAQMWAHGNIPEEFSSALCGANLTPLRKKDNGVRPIAVGEVLRRLVGKALLSTGAAKEEIAVLGPEQVGVGVPRACESVAIGMTSLINKLGPHSQQWAALLVDVKSAFQGVDRTCVLKSAETDAPTLFNFLSFTLTRSTPLYAGGRIIYSEAGVPQGCPLGPVAFSLGVHPVLWEITAKMSLIWNVWYLDDGLFVGDPDKVGVALQFLEKELYKRGLQVNRGKCVLWGPAGHSVPYCDGIQVTPWEPGHGITVLGTRIAFPGSTDHIDHEWANRLQEIEEKAAILTSLTEKQMAHHLLRHCLDACKVNHLLRSCDPYAGWDHALQADEVILSAFEDIVGCALTASQRTQACMPFSAGGCGIRSPTSCRAAARMSALLAYLGSGCHTVGVPEYAHSIPSSWVSPLLVDLETSLGPNFDPLPRWKGRHELLSTAEPQKWAQKFWGDAIGKAT